MNAVSLVCLDCNTSASARFSDAMIFEVVERYSKCACGSTRIAIQGNEPKQRSKRIRIIESIFTRSYIFELIADLTETEQYVVRNRMEGMTCKEIGSTLGISSNRIQKIYQKSITRMYKFESQGGYIGTKA